MLWRITPILGVVLALALTACDDDSTSPPQAPGSIDFVDHIDYGCVASRGGSLECLEGASLTRIEAVGDTVTLWIHFEANCCPEFSEIVSYDPGELTITVVDTVYACRCVCPFENAFRFMPEGSGQTRILFESRAEHGDGFCLSGMDTTVVLP
jgi:hypothetical protein